MATRIAPGMAVIKENKTIGMTILNLNIVKVMRLIALSKRRLERFSGPKQIVRIMKLTAILLTFFCLQVCAHGYGQGSITLSEQNVPAARVFKSIKKQTGIGFVYTDELLEQLGRISIAVKNATLDEVLGRILPAKSYRYNLSGQIVVIEKLNTIPIISTITNDANPPIDIRGKVTDEEGKPVMATINIKGSNRSVASNEKGEFSITGVSGNALLIITAVNIESREINVDNRNDLGNITVKIKFKEGGGVQVYATGYQDLKANETTGSFEKIGKVLLERQVSPNITNMLEGNASAVDFSRDRNSSNPQIYIRGISTIQAVTAPLIVVDKMIYEGDINNINPNDIESITVLKDAASAAQWGARSGNGVIVITTKKGKYGDKFKINFNSSVTIQEKPAIFSDPGFLNSSDFISVEKFLFSQGFYTSVFNNTTNRPVISPVVEILNKRKLGLISAADSAIQIGNLARLDVRDDYDKYLYQTAVNQQYSLNFSGGSDNINYFMGLGHDRNRSGTVGNSTERTTLYTISRFKPFKQLEIEAGINYVFTRSFNNSVTNDLIPGGGKTTLYPYAQLADANGSPLPTAKGYRNAYLDTVGGGLLLDWKFRPLDELNNNDKSTTGQYISLKLGLKYRLTSKFNITVDGQIERQNNERKEYYNVESYFTRNLINRFSQRSGNTIKYIIPAGGILDKGYNNLAVYDFRGQFNYANTWGAKHQLIAIAGSEVRNTHTTTEFMRAYGYNDDLSIYSNVDFVNLYPIYGGLASPAAIPNNEGFTDLLNRFVSLYSNASYTYNQRYILSASARKDASNIFGINSNQRWNPFWSAGAGWIISGEQFYHAKNWLPYLKLRMDYGYQGNINNGLSGYAIIGYQDPLSPNNLAAAYATPANPDLRWEKIGTTDIGLDFSMKDDRISGSLDYYQKKSVDLLSPTPVDPSIGVVTQVKNVAHLAGNGFNLIISARVIDRDFKWNVHFLFDYVTNKVTRYLVQSADKGSYVGGSNIITPIEGKDPFAMISYKWGGLDPQTGDPIGYINKLPSKDYANLVRPASFDDLVIHGSAMAPFHGSMLNSLSWKSITVSANILYKFNSYFRRNTISYTGLFNNWGGHTDFEKRWQKPGDELVTNVPSMIYPANTDRETFYQNSEATVENGGVIRLTDINVSYSPAKIRIGKYIMTTPPSVYVYFRNIGMLWKANKAGLDPEYRLPAPLSVAMGVRASF